MIEMVVSPLAMKVRRAPPAAALAGTLAAPHPQRLHIPGQAAAAKETAGHSGCSRGLGLVGSIPASPTLTRLLSCSGPREPADVARTAALVEFQRETLSSLQFLYLNLHMGSCFCAKRGVWR